MTPLYYLLKLAKYLFFGVMVVGFIHELHGIYTDYGIVGLAMSIGIFCGGFGLIWGGILLMEYVEEKTGREV